MKYYIYALLEPFTNKVKYVGQTKDLFNRYRTHTHHDSGHKKDKWVLELRKNGLIPGFQIIEETTKELVNEREHYWIAYFNAERGLVNSEYGSWKSRKVKNNKNEVFNSLTSAARKYNISHRTISAAISGKCATAAGLYWAFEENEIVYWPKQEKDSWKGKKIICTTNGKIYNSLKSAAKELNIKSAGISKCLTGYCKSTKGFHFTYYA